ncbi:MAG TPA: nitrogenase iron protein, partial [Methanocorpusculum sp.]|nr:nitrogenase iron protein [Methanocorpusculum sp.]
QFVPRDKAVQAAVVNQMTVIEHAPQSPQAEVYRELAKTILSNESLHIPKALELDELENLAREYL